MANKTAFIITDKEKKVNGIISNIDENTVEIVWEDETSDSLSNDKLDEMLETNKFEVHEVELDEDAADGDTSGSTPAQNTIKTHKTADANNGDADGNPKTRFDWVRKIIGGMANMDTETLTKIFNDQQAMVGGAPEHATDGKVGGNQASIKMHPSAAMESVKLQKDEMDKIFGESELTEETKVKLTALFETAVIVRLTEEVVRLQETYEKKLQESITEFTSEIKEDIDYYFNHVTEEWLTDNEVAIESTLKTELTTSFLDGLKTLFNEHYIDIPEDKVDIYEDAKTELENAKTELNKIMNESIEKDKVIITLRKGQLVAEASLGMTIPQREKFNSLIESVELDNEENFKLKLKTIKEGFVDTKPKANTTLSESNTTDETIVEENNDPMMDIVSKAIATNSRFSSAQF